MKVSNIYIIYLYLYREESEKEGYVDVDSLITGQGRRGRRGRCISSLLICSSQRMQERKKKKTAW